MARFLAEQEWELKRQRGSREMWEPQGGNQTFPVVQHWGEVSPGVIRQLQEGYPNTPKDWN